MNKPQRLHSLDNLRGIMMWLGIVVHASVCYMTGPAPTPWRDSQTSLLADLLIVFIHAFRMPVFFMLAGFFVSMLLARRGTQAMLQQRIRRLVWPFLVFWPLLFASMVVLIAIYAHLRAYDTVGIDFALIPQVPGRPAIPLLHLWFIYYLFLFCLLLALITYLTIYLPASFKNSFMAMWKSLAVKWWACAVLALPLALTGAFYRGGIVTPSGSFIPDIAEFIHSGMYFMSGIFLYQFQTDLLEIYIQRRWANLIAGLLILVIFLGISKNFETAQATLFSLKMAMAFLYNCVSWLWSFALIGLFLKYLPAQNRGLAYIADSSYWVYIVHLPLTIVSAILLYHSPFGAPTRLACNIALTTVVCLLSYQLLVRHSFIGRFLNGSKSSDNLPEQSLAANS
ncbi:acyltransferase family protein [Undibacterium sp. TJN19]|uniref:acyltransferase family protein n=1 Tax=Undibacterium sp. TJN19 TaxID=3413055 RepID=UPI003BF441FB